MAGNFYVEITGHCLGYESSVWCDNCRLPSLVNISVGIWVTEPGVELSADERATPSFVHVLKVCTEQGCPRFSRHLAEQ